MEAELVGLEVHRGGGAARGKKERQKESGHPTNVSVPPLFDKGKGATNNDGVSAINPKVIAELRSIQGGTPGFLVELIDQFLKEAVVLIGKLREARAARDVRALEQAAAALKGSCGNLGAQAMSRMCVELQAAGHAGDWPRATQLLRGLEGEFRMVHSELDAEKRR